MNESEANFVAETPAGEEFIGKPEINIPVNRAGEYVEKAVAAGLTVLPFPLIGSPSSVRHPFREAGWAVFRS